MGPEATNCNFLEKDLIVEFFPSNSYSLDWKPIRAANPRPQFFKEVTFCCLLHVSEEENLLTKVIKALKTEEIILCTTAAE